MTLGVPLPMHTQRCKFRSNQEILVCLYHMMTRDSEAGATHIDTSVLHLLTVTQGWNAIKSRSEKLGLSMSDDQYMILTAKIKQIADIRPLAIDDTDPIIRAHHHELKTPA
ncbi:Homocitrate synthase, mitochondrial [Metarhizium anisopliae]|nr:Homocitrate synthase, mitochondrial [Metarhizium anisopliae]